MFDINSELTTLRAVFYDLPGGTVRLIGAAETGKLSRFDRG